MRITSTQLRQIIREELIQLQEGRSNTFMASRMEETELDEQDRDGDGDADFDDVRVARFTASGMSKDKAVARVKRKPLGKTDSKKKVDEIALFRACVQASIQLDEIKLAGGYTYDPKFLPLSDEDGSEPAEPGEVSSDAEAAEDPSEAGQPTVQDFLDANPRQGDSYSGVVYYDVYGSKRASGPHGGIDLSDKIGTPIFAALGGVVTYAGKDTRSTLDASLKIYEPDGNSGPNGNYVKITHDDGTITMYLHLDTINVSTGANVTQGRQIGTLGNTGRSKGPHLHLHTYNSSSAEIDPIDWMRSHSTATFPVQVDTGE